MDIHKNFIQAAAMDNEGNLVREQKFKSNKVEITHFIQKIDALQTKLAIKAT